MSPPWPQLEQGDTPPRITPPNFHSKNPAQPPQSPSDYLRTMANTPSQQTLPELDPDITMTAPQLPQGNTTTIPRTPLTRTPTIGQPAPTPNCLGLNVLPGTPETPPTRQSLLKRLEEVASNQENDKKHPACAAINKYTPGPMPPIQDATPTSIFSNIELALLKEWDIHQGGKVLAIPFDPDVKSPESHDFYCSKILTAVTDIITTQEASVAAPRPSKDARSKNKTLTSFLIYNITPSKPPSS